jgi:hypothetical protein
MRQQHERLLGMRGQRRVTRPELVTKYGYDTKYAGHIVRLGYQGEELLLTGKITLPMPSVPRSCVLGVRTGKFNLVELSELLVESEKRLDSAYERSPLQTQPDIRHVEKWMIDTYFNAWSNRR